jgi:hypothetical protein
VTWRPVAALATGVVLACLLLMLGLERPDATTVGAAAPPAAGRATTPPSLPAADPADPLAEPPAAEPDGTIRILLQEQRLLPSVWLFDAGKTEHTGGVAIRDYRFDFGDGQQETTTSASIIHHYPRVLGDDGHIEYHGSVTVTDADGRQATQAFQVTVDNRTGQLAHQGINILEVSDCHGIWQPGGPWTCSINLFNGHAEAITLHDAVMTYVKSAGQGPIDLSIHPVRLPEDLPRRIEPGQLILRRLIEFPDVIPRNLTSASFTLRGKLASGAAVNGTWSSTLDWRDREAGAGVAMAR